MTAFGNHLKMDAARSLRAEIRHFYGTLLGCESLPGPMPDIDLFRFENDVFVGVFYHDDPAAVLSPPDLVKSAWLEIKTADPDALKQALLAAGVAAVDFPDPTRFYFQAPGGQVYRLAPMDGGI